MKKTLLIVLALMLSFGAFAQVVLNEDFSGGVMPPAGWSIDGQPGNWSVTQTTNAGGQVPEARMNWSPQFNTTTRLISPTLNLTGKTTALFQFKQTIDHYSGSYQIGVDIRSGGSAWTNVWARTVTSGVTAEELSIVITDPLLNSADFQLCIFFSGSSYNINYWYLDDFVLLIPAENDLAMSSIDVPKYFTGQQPVSVRVVNFGLTPVTSARFNWQIDDTEIHSQTLSGQNLTLGNSLAFTFTDQIDLPAGVYNLMTWIDQVNGSAIPDDVPANDSLSMSVHIPTQTLGRLPLFEEFTSSTCAPCASFNNGVFNPFIAQHGDELVLVKYQMSWPAPGDPYYTAEGGTRRTFYGVNAVPMLFVDGKNVATSAAAVNAAFNSQIAKPAFVKIEGYYTIEGNVVEIAGDVTAYTDIDNVTLHVVVFENMTTGNVGNNGETQFHHVMMRILPNGNGTPAILESNVPLPVNFEVDMTGTHVEEMDDLAVAIFLQENTTQEIFQAAYATLTGALINSDPPNNATNVYTEEPLLIEFSQPVRHIGGEELTPGNVNTVVSLEKVDAELTPVEFTAEVNAEKTMITITPVEELEEATAYRLTVLPLENYSGTPTLIYVSNFVTRSTVGTELILTKNLSVYPNPARTFATLTGLSKIEGASLITIADVSGKQIRTLQLADRNSDSLNLDVSTLNNGIYLVTVTGAKSAETYRLAIIK